MTKCLMIQGTASNAGKSLIVAALCRIYTKRGYKVAPFKSQNMSLNSYTTKENKEIAIAQVLQAKAANIEPTVDMNPILLKPKGESCSQVIIQGEAVGNKDFFRKYDKTKATQRDIDNNLMDDEDYRIIAKEAVIDSLNNLKEDYDIIIMEGAGSPAEINLREGDLANMGAAEIADANVLLVGDIDKGGVFASIAGTFLLLDDADRSRFKGVIINKFRGKQELLCSGIERLEEIIQVPVLGIVPYAENLQLPEEDSASLKEHNWTKEFKNNDDHIIIGVVKLPKIANFTDIDPFDTEDDVEVRMIEVHNYKDKIKDIDALILPGTRNSTEDIMELEKTGLAQEIRKLSNESKIPIIGICGGYQILGNKIYDKNHKESKLDEVEGLGLLDIESEFIRESKVVKQSIGRIEINDNITGLNNSDENNIFYEIFSKINGETVSGYELHEGTTNLISAKPLFKIEKGIGNNDNDQFDGAYSKNVFGTYFHGIFNNYNLRREFLNHLRKNKGLDEKTGEDPYETSVENSLEKLANIVEEALDMDYIDKLVFDE
ncbi:cobyric acid synthase CbiP [Methanobrevibacter ruminantium M1]|uniref:Probable cobyric acid synthase n=1 Tax=Methanobrevibacter ruminantium (strain ATCC 35063 / DSM 1093 / JCM 13430 / OCM 146 / M1) TaxID=634498 RepID=D3E4U4_METRM|nr:cobyric acid synthase CobQ [Methanobrevibacter ruminantium]ADC47488.1 cobyric acid synthase CbiP [Methanobrevibacter ruminantium M1]